MEHKKQGIERRNEICRVTHNLDFNLCYTRNQPLLLSTLGGLLDQ